MKKSSLQSSEGEKKSSRQSSHREKPAFFKVVKVKKLALIKEVKVKKPDLVKIVKASQRFVFERERNDNHGRSAVVLLFPGLHLSETVKCKPGNFLDWNFQHRFDPGG
ncbi:hypothetical protein TNCV_2361891 [Trichonephila clavipes]|nr:hypothetical protein TNCV_2361891 [Trichonephila clavipes]